MNDVHHEIAALRDLIQSARSMPMSASAVINRQEFLDAAARLEAALEKSSSESRAVLADRDAVVAEGEQIAIEVVRQAELKRDELVSDTEVFRLATREADQIRTEAAADAAQMKKDTDAYIEQRFANFEHALERTLAEVRRGIENLAGSSSFADPTEKALPPSDDVLLTGPDAG
ncbi:hypothetical protein ncot_05925 [Nocardioides sp. JQ2195]|uniref:hypothetical protein n=1 Tax=Nocardioides sp. JQ2195 TaxID=2592334 RepID=UPI00143EC7A3|nr:hypothetical protein [Nocardioides sp. JQ2195]QIX26191.1 hypothetical protein ncot_05925 [Nocardioides sp. JQ2195]